jgi:hypothetical protein
MPIRTSSKSNFPKPHTDDVSIAKQRRQLMKWKTCVVSTVRCKSALGQRELPQIRLSGAWLKRAGFTPGTRFLVIIDATQQILLAALKNDGGSN